MVSEAKRWNNVKLAHQRLFWSASHHPLILVTLAPLYLFLSFLLGSAVLLLTEAAVSRPADPDLIGGIIILVFYPLVVLPWLHFLYLAIATFKSVLKAREPNTRSDMLRVCQAIGVAILGFAMLHYYIYVFSDGTSYAGMHSLPRTHSWLGIPPIDQLTTVPSLDTAVDFIYFSATTMATVGFGDIHPVGRMAKLATIAEIVFGFALVVITLSGLVGRQDSAPPQTDA